LYIGIYCAVHGEFSGYPGSVGEPCEKLKK